MVSSFVFISHFCFELLFTSNSFSQIAVNISWFSSAWRTSDVSLLIFSLNYIPWNMLYYKIFSFSLVLRIINTNFVLTFGLTPINVVFYLALNFVLWFLWICFFSCPCVALVLHIPTLQIYWLFSWYAGRLPLFSPSIRLDLPFHTLVQYCLWFIFLRV